MATVQTSPKAQDKSNRSKLVTWMKRLAKTKGSSKKGNQGDANSKHQSSPGKQNEVNDYAHKDASGNARINGVGPDGTNNHPNNIFNGGQLNRGDGQQVTDGSHSIAPTLDINPGTISSDMIVSEGDRHSKAGTAHTLTGGVSSLSGGGGNSIFSSSNHSSHSLTTTLTTIQSAPSNAQLASNQVAAGTAPPGTAQGANHSSQPSQGSTYFSHQYPTTPASAVPSHLNPHVPTTYRSATANNLLTDNASVLTLASSSHRPQRRNSLDTNASIRAIAPSSVWGGSRESLPLSVLSHNAEQNASTGATPPPTAGLGPAGTRTSSGYVSSDRHASGFGVSAPTLSSERNSIYAGNKTPQADGLSLNDHASA